MEILGVNEVDVLSLIFLLLRLKDTDSVLNLFHTFRERVTFYKLQRKETEILCGKYCEIIKRLILHKILLLLNMSNNWYMVNNLQ